MIFADIVFPVFTTPYRIIWVIPWVVPVVLIAEWIVFWRFYPALKSWLLVAGVIGANVFSWLVGVFLVGFLPRGYAIDPDTNTIAYNHWDIVLSFLIAYVLCVLLEYAVWRVAFWKSPLPAVGRANALANTISYALLIVISVVVALV